MRRIHIPKRRLAERASNAAQTGAKLFDYFYADSDFLLVQASEPILLEMLRSAHTHTNSTRPSAPNVSLAARSENGPLLCYLAMHRALPENVQSHYAIMRSHNGAPSALQIDFTAPFRTTTTTFGTSTTQIIHLRGAAQCAAGRFDG